MIFARIINRLATGVFILICGLASGRALPATSTLSTGLTQKQIVALCEHAFNTNLPSSGLTKHDDDVAITQDEHAEAAAIRQIQHWLKQPASIKLLNGILAHSKTTEPRFVAIAYVLGYNGIDVVQNIHRLNAATLTEYAVEDAPQHAFEIYQRYPSPTALRELLLIHSDGSGQEALEDTFGGFFLRHYDAIMTACQSDNKVKLNVADTIYGTINGESADDYAAKIMRRLRASARSSADMNHAVANYFLQHIARQDRENAAYFKHHPELGVPSS